MKSVRLSLAVCGLGLALAAPSLAQDLAVHAGTVITMAGKPIQDGVVLIRGGRIVAVGPAAGVKVPATVKVLRVKDGVVMPGMVNPNTFYGMSRTRNESNPITPFITSADAINPVDEYFKDGLRVGYTSLHVIPYRDCILGGTGTVVRPVGKTVAAMTAAGVRIQKMSLSKRGLARIRAIQMLEKTFGDMQRELKETAARRAEDKAEAKAKGEKKDPGKKDEKKPLDAKKRDLAALVQGQGRALFYCANPDDMVYAIRFARRWRFTMVPILDNSCWKHVRYLRMVKLPAIVDPTMEFTYTDPVTEKKEVVCLAAKLHEAGVPFAISTGYNTDIPTTYPLYQAAVAVRNGVPRQVALQAVTTVPARILGLEKRIGSLEKGKDGNLVILNGDPLATFTLLEKVIVEGKVAYDRAEDPVMKDIVAREKAAKAAREKAAKEKAAKEKAAKAKAAKAKAAKAKKGAPAPKKGGGK